LSNLTATRDIYKLIATNLDQHNVALIERFAKDAPEPDSLAEKMAWNLTPNKFTLNSGFKNQ
jgi:hypothetical protein